MKKQHLASVIFMALMLMCSLSSCTTKQGAINQLQDFSYELRDYSHNYSIRQWEKAGKRFVKIRKNISKHELDYTPSEKRQIGRLEGECAGYMAKGLKEGFYDRAIGFKEELKSIIESILKAFSRQ